MNKKICFILAIVILMASIGALSAFAEGDSPMPAIYADNKTVTAGNTFEIVVRASDFNAVGALDLYAFYDPEIFTLLYTDTLSLASGAQTTINTDVAGEVCFSMISASGISGSDSLWYLTFQVDQNTVAGVYPITLAAGNAYNTALDPIDVSVSSPRITVNSAVQEQKYLYFYSYGTSPTLYNGDTVTVSFATNNLYGLASADFELEYDETLLRFESVALGSKLTSAQNAIYSANSTTPGYVKLSYVATAGVTGSLYPMISATFTVISSTATTTQVGLKVSGIYDEDLNIMIGSSAQYALNLAEIIETPKLPEITVSGFEGMQDAFSVSVKAPGSSALAAVDLLFSFNPRQIICTDVSSTATGCFVISNIDNENGTIKLSFICEDGISIDTEIAKISFSTENLLGGSVKLNVSGKNAVTAHYETLTFVYQSPTFICHKIGPPATCTTPQICTICSKELVSSLGHTNAVPVEENKVEPTCFKDGSYDSVTYCSICKAEVSREVKRIDKLGHDYATEWTTDVEPTCTGKGSKSHHCSRCDDKVDVTAIPANGHSYGEWYETKAPTCTATGTDEHECSVCHNKETRTIDVKEHTPASAVVENRVEPNCTVDGSYDCVIYCSVCTAELSREIKSIDKLGHDYSTKWTEDLAPTCTTAGSKSHHCSRCEDKAGVTEIPANGHKCGEWTQTLAPTCTVEGSERKDCEDCNYYETQSIDALGHNHSTEWTTDIEPTCTTVGSQSHHCSRCEDKADITEIPAIGHEYGEWFTHDSQQHKRVCACGETEFADHLYDNEADANCNVCGATREIVTVPPSEKPGNNANAEKPGCGASVSSGVGVFLLVMCAAMSIPSRKKQK